MGGPERIERLMTARGKLDARTRLDLLFDADSFVELGALVGGTDVPADALVAGFGKVDGRSVLAAAEDFTVLGGSIGAGSMAKRHRVCELALEERVPLVFMLDGAGHRLTETEAHGRVPNDLLALADLSGEVPMVCLVLGASAGHGALTSPLSDFTVMSEAASMFTGGPPLVKAALGEDVTKEELGGPKVCEAAGTTHNVAPDDAAAIAQARRYLSYFPSRHAGPLPSRAGADTGPRLVNEILDIIPPNDRKPYKMRKVVELLVDEGSWFEIQPGYGRSMATGLAFLGGRPVAIVANDPWVRSGSVDSEAAIKAMDFLETAGRFGLPVIFLADNPGVMAGTKAERSGILKWAGKMFRAQRRLQVPKISVTFRKAFGFGSSTMAANPFDHQTLMLSFPSVTMNSMPAASGGAAAKLDAETQARVEDVEAGGPWRAAAGMGYDDIIDPRELRNAILGGLELARARTIDSVQEHG
ncbi:MAG: acetyl-CoA carboxylase carboxyltransferase subunit [Deltaproteobacteria bacterium]|nr:acetyl-CoA carboxylase carboxyltransferase subunit [Deltaproteobacteria bacterium]MBW2394044.1 acetyl-CoA carboxylase carboxyltransferase subunit [Deltaproteobacteria bacterium]